MANSIDYEDYWNMVIGPCRTALSTVVESDLQGATRRDVDEWLGTCEETAQAEMNEDNWLDDDICYDWHEKALNELMSAIGE